LGRRDKALFDQSELRRRPNKCIKQTEDRSLCGSWADTKMKDKESEKQNEIRDYLDQQKAHLTKTFTERELRLMLNCIVYAEMDPAGLPGHNLMIILAKLCVETAIDGIAIKHALGEITTEKMIEDYWSL